MVALSWIHAQILRIESCAGLDHTFMVSVKKGGADTWCLNMWTALCRGGLGEEMECLPYCIKHR